MQQGLGRNRRATGAHMWYTSLLLYRVHRDPCGPVAAFLFSPLKAKQMDQCTVQTSDYTGHSSQLAHSRTVTELRG
jgi:hypothetical protein